MRRCLLYIKNTPKSLLLQGFYWENPIRTNDTLLLFFHNKIFIILWEKKRTQTSTFPLKILRKLPLFSREIHNIYSAYILYLYIVKFYASCIYYTYICSNFWNWLFVITCFRCSHPVHTSLLLSFSQYPSLRGIAAFREGLSLCYSCLI